MRIALVIQRYGDGIIGGAERHARELAERLHESCGFEVDVYTTTARDYRTWKSELPEGESSAGGVKILRFAPRRQRAPVFFLVGRLLAGAAKVARKLGADGAAMRFESLWFALQGPFCPDLIETLVSREAQYQKILFMAYLYYPTVAGLPRVREKAVLIPLAHDEGPFHFLTTRRLLRAAPVIFANSEAEARLVASKLAASDPSPLVVGLGIDDALPTQTKPPSEPYVLYLGRISRGKGVVELIRWFEEFENDVSAPNVRLFLAGDLEADVKLPESARIRYFGTVSEAEKLELLAGSRALVNPSAWESLSLITLEAMAARVPAIVNRRSEVLADYAAKSSSVIAFEGSVEFRAALERILASDWQKEPHATALDKAREWALESFSWKRILQVYRDHIQGYSKAQ